VTAGSGTSTISATGSSTLVRGGTYVASGTLTYSNGGAASGKAVTVSATSPAGGTALLGSTTTGTGGSWTYSVPAAAFTTAGTWTITASVTASVPWPATLGTVVLTVADPGGDTTIIIIIIATNSGDHLDGNEIGNIIRGLLGNDVLNGLGGNDSLFGDAGSDTLNGGAGNDKLTGGPGKDKLNGQAGNDTIDANDHKPGDIVNCGPGKDTARVNKGDKVKGCEKVIIKK
ncbi:MAG: hypothetical protein H7123_01365, partial [Thermoleophilia bacterium]|nr:hypothetical protein [Thermoleophilia bacterium]